jgi:hypothetical protein
LVIDLINIVYFLCNYSTKQLTLDKDTYNVKRDSLIVRPTYNMLRGRGMTQCITYDPPGPTATGIESGVSYSILQH